MNDRTVHAEAEGEEVVRYDRSGKWYLELADGSRKRVGIAEAARRALELQEQGGTIHLDLPGGQMFDSRVRSSS